MEKYVKIYPTVEDLKTANTTVHCKEDGCTKVFASESNLMLHVVKVHQRASLQKCNTLREYYCPEPNCAYNELKYFKQLKQVKQHYLKVHSEKKIPCELCNQMYATECERNRHKEYCGVYFRCCECPAWYPLYESLLTHGRRKNHIILEKSGYKPIAISADEPGNTSNSTDVASSDVQVLKVIALISMPNHTPYNKASQTDTCIKVPMVRTRPQIMPTGRHSSKQSQTYNTVKVRFSTETQTICDYIPKKVRKIASSENTRSAITQTVPVTSKTKSCNTSLGLEELETGYAQVIESNSSSTQTTTTIPMDSLNSASTVQDSVATNSSDLNFEFMNSSCQTSFSDDMSVFDSTNFFNMETQTDFMFCDELLNYNDCYSHIETQTNDTVPVKDIIDVQLYSEYLAKDCSDILFNTTQTQTVSDDIFRSVESQTLMSTSGMQSLLTIKDIAHIETQTDIDFKTLLEEINA